MPTILIVAALGLTSYAEGSTSSFTDMSGAAWAQGFVGYAESLGVLKGDGNGKFRPSDTVTYNEMATIVIRALGYTDESLAGTWPANYVSKAKTLGIMDDITGGGGAVGANRGDVAIMIYNALGLGIGSVDKDNNWSTETTTSNGTTVYGDTMYIRLGVKSNTGAYVITYDNAKDAAANVMPYVGAYATTLMNKDGDIISINEVKSTFLSGKMSGSKFKADGVEYTIEPTNGVGATTAGALVFNNAALQTAKYTTIGAVKAASTDTVTWSVKLSGTTIKEVYAVLDWNVDQHDFFATTDAEDITEDAELMGVDFEKDDNGDIDTSLFALNGAASLADIQKDDVVYVYESNGAGKVVRIDVGTEEVSGEVTKISSDGKDYTIGGKVYSKAAQMATSSISTVKAGDEVKAILDYSGKVYKFEKISGAADSYCVVIDFANGATGLNGNEPKMKLILSDGTIATYDADEEEIADAILVESTKAFTAEVSKGTVFKYALDSDSVITELTTCAATAVVTKDITKSGYYNGAKIADDAVIFTYDGDVANVTSTKSEDWGITTKDKVLDTKSVAGKYVTKDGIIVAMLINAAATSDDDVYGIITGGADNNSDAKHEITVWVDGTEATYNTKTAFTSNETTKGKLYKFEFDTAGNIKYTEQATSSQAIGTSVTINGNVVKFGGTLGEKTFADDAVIYTWSAGDKKYKKGSLRDVKNGTDYTNVYIFDTDSTPDGVIDIALVK